ncbi:MAG: hypothetical protein U5L96_13000 [Owenweeksia sp.]|nr:hypothetical protein [Owenweeksia sp.]
MMGWSERMTRPLPNCNDIYYNAIDLIPYYYGKGQRDSMETALQYWLQKCEPTDESDHLEILLSLEADSLDLSLYPDITGLLTRYYHRQNDTTSGQYSHQYQSWQSKRHNYYHFLKSLAQEMLSGSYDEALKRDLLRYYAGDFAALKKNLREQNYPGSPIDDQYQSRLKELVESSETHVALFAGAWLPLENLSELGIHPTIGAQLGFFSHKMHYDLTFGFRFINTPNTYRAFANDSTYETKRFVNYYLGAEISRSLHRDLRSDFEVGFGLGLENMNLQPYDEENDIDGVNLTTFAMNIGLGYRYYFNFKDFIKVDLRYHFLNYSNNINDQLQGDVITTRIIIGWSNRTDRQRQLQALGH